MIRALRVLAPLAFGLGACSTTDGHNRPPRPVPAVSVAGPCGIVEPQLWARGELPSQFRFQGVRVGGLSGIDYRPREKDYLLITDDRGPEGGGRVYRAALGFDADRAIAIRILYAAPLRRADGSMFAKEGETGPGTDAEAIRAHAGWIYWANEAQDPSTGGPQVFRMRLRDGKSFPVALPARLVPDSEGRSGPRDNRSFEGLAIGPDNSLWLGIEAPLREDGPLPSLAAGSWTRIVELPVSGKTAREYVYPLEPIARQIPGRLADNGLSELLALPGPAFLVLERSGSQQDDGGFQFVTRLFCAQPSGEMDANGTPRLRKRLVVELNALGPFDNANFEGMTFGPRLPDGRRSLILVADNDFRAERPNIIVALAFR